MRSAIGAGPTVSAWRLLGRALKSLDKDPRLVLVGAMNGNSYGDNARSIYEWLLAWRPELKPVWLTRNRDVYDELRRAGRPTALMASGKGLIALGRAKVGLYTHSLYDLAHSPFLVPDTLRLIALRHGKSVKKVRFGQAEMSLTQNQLTLRRYESSLVSFAISTSDSISDFQEESLRIGRAKHVVTGYPRNDGLLDPSGEMRTRWREYAGERSPRQVVLYAPSWRHGRAPTRFFPFDDFARSDLVDFIETNGLLVLLRPHPNDLRLFPEMGDALRELASSSAAIRIASADVLPDIHRILAFIDLLITDYSSLYHDFLLLDRPMMFIPYDYHEYEKHNGFHYDYFANLPGPAVSTQREFIACLTSVLDGKDNYRSMRANLAAKVHLYRDARSCERVAGLVETILGGDASD